MKISVPKETAERERRVALVPEVVQRLTGDELEVAVESGAGAGARPSGQAFQEAAGPGGGPPPLGRSLPGGRRLGGRRLVGRRGGQGRRPLVRGDRPPAAGSG